MLCKLNTVFKRREPMTHKRLFMTLGLAIMTLAAGAFILIQWLSYSYGTLERRLLPDFARLPLYFVPTAGQTGSNVQFTAQAPHGAFYFSPSEVTLAASSAVGEASDVHVRTNRLIDEEDVEDVVRPANPVELSIRFAGSNPSPKLTSEDQLPGKVNYLIGNDPSEWRTNLPTYSQIRYQSLYPGVDLTYTGEGSNLKGTYILAPGADPNLIRWSYENAETTALDDEGNLQITVGSPGAASERLLATEHAPVAWQDVDGRRLKVDVRYNFGSDGTLGFLMGDYDHALPLYIDPTLTYSTYLGGNELDYGYAIAVDASGNAYITVYGWQWVTYASCFAEIWYVG